MTITQTLTLAPSPESYAIICDALISDEVCALPTETVYGLAGNAFSVSAVEKIFEAKERPQFDPLIVHISDRYLKSQNLILDLVQDGIIGAEILNWTNLSVLEKTMRAYWPGPLTLILPRGTRIPDLVTDGKPTVGIRMPNHPDFQAILSAIHFPLAAPSANRFGRISPTQAIHVNDELRGRIPYILDGGSCAVGVESTIIFVKPNSFSLLRPGGVLISDIEIFLGAHTPATVSTDVSPGSLDDHYAPTKALYLIDGTFPEDLRLQDYAWGVLVHGKMCGFLVHHCLPVMINGKNIVQDVCVKKISAEKLYAHLRELDQDPHVQVILCDSPPAGGINDAIRDRLNRASRNKPL